MTDKEDAFLDDLFADARVSDPVPSDALQARVLADAAAAHAEAAPLVARRRVWTQLFALFGGWPALSGVAAAGVAGLWLGLSPPVAVENLAADLLGTTTSVSFSGSFEELLGEGQRDG